MRVLLDRLLRRFIVTGRLRVVWPDGRASVYAGAPGGSACMALRDARTVRRLVTNPALACGECYRSEERRVGKECA